MHFVRHIFVELELEWSGIQTLDTLSLSVHIVHLVHLILTLIHVHVLFNGIDSMAIYENRVPRFWPLNAIAYWGNRSDNFLDDSPDDSPDDLFDDPADCFETFRLKVPSSSITHMFSFFKFPSRANLLHDGGEAILSLQAFRRRGAHQCETMW